MNFNYWKEIDKGGLMFDFEDFYTHIAHNLPDNCTLAEIGVANGKSLLFMAAQLAKLNKNFTIHAIDNMDYGSDFQEQTLKEHIAASGFADQVKLHRSDSLAASRLFADGCFDFVFIDAMHTYQFVQADIRLWQYKVKKGGTLAGHDSAMPVVKQAVDEFAAHYSVNYEPTANGLGLWWFII